MVATYTRESRDFDFVPSSGSSLVIGRYNADGSIADLTTLDIETCRITEIFKNKVTTHSGHNGCTGRTRTGSDWNFTAHLSFPADIAGGLREAFAEPLLGSMRSVGVRFNIGDPKFWTDRGLEIRSLRAEKCLLAGVVHDLDSNSGLGVATMDVTGESNSLLWTYFGDVPGTPQYPQIWLV